MSKFYLDVVRVNFSNEPSAMRHGQDAPPEKDLLSENCRGVVACSCCFGEIAQRTSKVRKKRSPL